MPQPFPDYAEKHEADLNDAAIKRPTLAVRAADVIAVWSNFEGAMGVLFTVMLGAEPAPAAAVYDSIRSDNGRRDAFRAVADQCNMPLSDRAILDFIVDRSKGAGQARDAIAHSLWATQAEFPDALLLIDPKVMAATRVKLAAAKGEKTEGDKLEAAKELIKVIRKATSIWKEQDFIDARVRIGKLLYLAVTFAIVLSHDTPETERQKARAMMLQANDDLAAYIAKKATPA